MGVEDDNPKIVKGRIPWKGVRPLEEITKEKEALRKQKITDALLKINDAKGKYLVRDPRIDAVKMSLMGRSAEALEDILEEWSDPLNSLKEEGADVSYWIALAETLEELYKEKKGNE